jgi:hypothetical protein
MSNQDRTLALRIARRRNEHLRGGAEFLRRIRRHTGWTGEADIALVEPSDSIEFEDRTYARLREGIASGGVTRWCHLPLEDAVSRCRGIIERIREERLNVILCRSPEFVFHCPASLLTASLASLVALDGDSVTAAASDVSTGFALDVETEAPSASYEVDAW